MKERQTNDDDDSSRLRKNATHTQYKFPDETKDLVSPEAKDLISKLLVNNPGTYSFSTEETLTRLIDERISVFEALQHPFFLSAIPDHIPKYAMKRPPEYKDLFDNFQNIETSSQTKSRLALEVEKAKDVHQSYIDNDIRPPMTILQETIYDPRSQYPVQQQDSQPLIPNTGSKKRTASITSPIKKDAVSTTTKRLCSDGDISVSQKKSDVADKPFGKLTCPMGEINVKFNSRAHCFA